MPRASTSTSRGVGRHGADRRALEPLGFTRQIASIVAGFSTAIALARDTDLIASVPERHTAHSRRLALLCPAADVADLYRGDALAPTAGRRPGPPLAARVSA